MYNKINILLKLILKQKIIPHDLKLIKENTMYNNSLTTIAQSKTEYCKNNCFEVITAELSHQLRPA